MNTPLNALVPGQRGRVCGFATLDELAEHLMQMGIIEGAEIEMLRCAPAGDPLEVRVMGYALSLRRAEAANVLLDNVHSA